VTLVLLTPVGLDATAWDAVDLPAGAVRHEWPGFGSRPRAARPLAMAELADDVARLYDGELDVAGCSMGGMVGQHLAIRHPERVRSLLMACTGAFANPETMEQRAVAVETTGMEGVLGTTLERWFTAGALAQRPEHPGVAYARRVLLALDPGSFADGWRSIATHDARPGLGAVRAPTTCVAGDADASASVARVREVADGIPGARMEVVHGPHMLPLEQPDTWSELLRDHLAWATCQNDRDPDRRRGRRA
jgi:pimeloyl-ACP methyl ester carboxylesterase